VTAQTALRRSDLPRLRRSGPLARLVGRQATAFAEDEHLDARYGQPCPGLPDDLVNFQHDPLACAVALGWDGATVETIALTMAVKDGWLRLRPDPHGRPFRVVTAVDAARFSAYWLAALASRTAPAC
jgi:hypothetical protein